MADEQGVNGPPPGGCRGAPADALDGVIRAMRQRLYDDNEFRCLPSFLHALADQCRAKEAGVFALHRGQVTRRRVTRDPSSFDAIRDVLVSATTPDTFLRKHNYFRCVPLGDHEKYLILCRIWPAASWHDRSGESYWLYVLEPTPIIAPKGLDSDDLVAQFGGLASAFIPWKNEVIARHDELLAAATDHPEVVVREFQKLVIRPVRPKDFYAIITGFRFNEPLHPLPDLPPRWARWAGYLDQLLGACLKRPTCRCHTADDGGVPNPLPFQCPQTAGTDKVLRVLANLALWQTDFWRADRPDRGDRWADLLRRGLDGLADAADALLYLDADRQKPINFWEGAVGLAGERTLIRFFCSRAIRMALDRHRVDWAGSRAHPNDLDFPARLASLAATLLGDGRWAPEAIQNLLHVVSMFGHRVLDIPGRIDLGRHLNETLRGETALHTLKSRYRDHFFHTLEVCFLGFALLASRPNPGTDTTFARWVLDRCPVPPGAPVPGGEPVRAVPADEADFLAQWWAAALIHDTAYGIDILDGTLTLLDFFSNRGDIKAFLDTTRRGVGEMAGKLTAIAPELGGDTSRKKGDHGVIAAAGLLEAVTSIGPRTRERFLPAVRAVAFHNTRHPAVDAARDPVAALLILCDSVQEWGRSSLGFDRSPAVLLSRMMEATATPAEEQFGPVKRYGIALTGGPHGYAWADPGRLRIELDYGPDSLTECKAKQTWADLTYNLQRVDFRPWEVGLSVRISIPLPEPRRTGANGKPVKTQFEYFGEFIKEQEVRFLEDWFRTASRGEPTAAVCHAVARRAPGGEWDPVDPGEAGARETILLNLRELGAAYCDERPLMGSTAGRFMEAMRVWSGYARELPDNPAAQHPPH